MSGGLDGLRERLAAFLREKGLRAMTDWRAEPRGQGEGGVVGRRWSGVSRWGVAEGGRRV